MYHYEFFSTVLDEKMEMITLLTPLLLFAFAIIILSLTILTKISNVFLAMVPFTLLLWGTTVSVSLNAERAIIAEETKSNDLFFFRGNGNKEVSDTGGILRTHEKHGRG